MEPPVVLHSTPVTISEESSDTNQIRSNLKGSPRRKTENYILTNEVGFNALELVTQSDSLPNDIVRRQNLFKNRAFLR